MMIDSCIGEELLLCNQDFPSHFHRFAHPDDYRITSQAISPEYLYHTQLGRHNRLIFRVSFAGRTTGQYASMSFVIDTGAPKHMYLSAPALCVLQELGLLHVDVETDLAWITLFGRKVPVDETPECHKPANILGLRMLGRLGLRLHEYGFSFDLNPLVFEQTTRGEIDSS